MSLSDFASTLRARLGAVRQAIAASEMDSLLITEIVNVGYVTGFTGSSAFALVTADRAELITDSRYTLRAQNECPHFDIVIASGSGGYLEALKGLLEAKPVRTLGFESERVTVSQWEHFKEELPAVEWKATSNIVENLRAIKDTGEVDKIRAAIAVAENAFTSVYKLLRPGISERDFAIELEFAMRKGGAESVAFETIVASGPQSAHPHHRPNDRILASGDWVTVDWGASVDGYCSDITRTVFLGPAKLLSTDKRRRVYDVVLRAQQKAIAAIRPGKNGFEIDAIARDYITEQGYGDNFGHSLGHALGRTVHDGPGLSKRAADVIMTPGMVLTVEPGIYIENWGGIRIEEDILVTTSGCEVLTHLPNGLEEIG